MRWGPFLLLVAACGHATPPRTTPDEDAAAVNAAADEFVRVVVESNPDRIALQGWVEARHDRFTDRSRAAVAAWDAAVDELWEQTRGIDLDRLYGRPEWVTLGFLREALESSRATRVCRFELWSVDPNAGLHVLLTDLARAQPETDDARWAQMPAVIDAEIANLREGLRTGYTAARDVVDRVVKQLDGQLALPAEQSPYLPAASAELVASTLDPALQRYRDFLANEYRPEAREALGVSANPDGEACWRASFRDQTSIDRDPEETVRLGTARVAGFAAEAEEIAAASDAKDGAAPFADGDALLAFSKDAVERAHDAMDQLVLVVPDAPVAVEPYPAFLGVGVSPSYDPMPEDGSRPATYWINLEQPLSRGEAELTAFHETWPGHHLQIATADDLPERHRLTKLVGVGSYVEGWARYAEQLADEIGLYTSPYARIRRRTWPGRGMVVDPGIHLHGWTRQQAIDYMVEGGFPPDVADGLVDRIAAWPAQLTSYDTGALEILALREEAKSRLGDRFDLRAFDSCVLSQGAVTLPMLRTVVEACAR